CAREERFGYSFDFW
nr:immunoglobulin heavy chain junction region [Macaca mulatta]MOX59184.1 immunoglobulin heavy chain junction region [Macaca mulatta]MOX59449.1 immunoglobulin heavy chain junction region [Macaca mulatta]MOX59843.1 immunoglobulin heavy chain junction region [Macaca mulatta]MOX62452.1 immunoglobulin heavy chain junction region [Macaca mulatta]